MVPRAEDATLPEPTPNLSMEKTADDYVVPSNGNSAIPNNKFKVRVPMERRYRLMLLAFFTVYSPFRHLQLLRRGKGYQLASGNSRVQQAFHESLGHDQEKTRSHRNHRCARRPRVEA